MRIAVDAMGGDHQPGAPVAGALAALEADPDLRVALVGRPEALTPELGGAPARLRSRCEVVPASEVIGPGEAPTAALREKRDSSIAVGLGLCKRGEADGFVSAGNTGALMAGAFLTFGRLPGVQRPALPVVLPTVNGQGLVILDVGAHLDADARNLYDFAVMGSLFAERARGIRQPRVALLNVGTEERKGTAVSREAFALLQAAPLRFVGNIEGRDLFGDRADVVVTDGFVGNVVIKVIEGFGIGISQVMGRALRHSGLLTLVGAALAARTLRGLRKQLDYAEYGGVPLLGLQGLCVKCHGSSDARALKNGIRATAGMARSGLVREIAASLAERAAPGLGAEGETAGD